MLIAEVPFHQIKIITGNLSGKISIVGFKAQVPSNFRLKQSQTFPENGCGMPDVIPQSQWRSGLPVPVYSRIFTEVNHLIIHHTATYNYLTNYVNVVRNIYLFHTVERGWSDIGYNYLIAPDGNIFAGRDPLQAELQDQVLGAHFCGSNSGTMGIAMIGTFTEILPTQLAIGALISLLIWKADKSILLPFNENPHPANPELPVIAGHRDGCATECPGSALYRNLPEIRIRVAENLADCNVELAQTIYPNPIQTNRFYLVWNSIQVPDIQIYDVRGLRLDHYSIRVNEHLIEVIFPQIPASGLYLIKVEGSGASFSGKLMVSGS